MHTPELLAEVRADHGIIGFIIIFALTLLDTLTVYIKIRMFFVGKPHFLSFQIIMNKYEDFVSLPVRVCFAQIKIKNLRTFYTINGCVIYIH